MTDSHEQELEPEDHPPERPIECSECKKPIAIRYTEVTKDSITETKMCADCPHLKRHLKGTSPTGSLSDGSIKAGVTCGDCGTSLESIEVGHPLGCSHCYEVFAENIFEELQARNKIPLKEDAVHKAVILHIGRIPGETVEVSPSLRLIALNEALSEMLKREDYEQAAMIRDQINALTDSPKETKEK